MIELTCLGPVRVTIDGQEPPPELLWRKNLALLIYLALTPRGASRDQLIGLLWSEKDDAKARHSLNEALRVVRRATGKSLESKPDRVSLKSGAVRTDLASPAAGGTFLDGFTVPDAPEFDRWVSAERERRRSATLDALAAQADRALDQGHVTRARTLAEQALAVDSHDEPAARALMRAWALAGARSRALAVFDQLRASLKRDLDLAPDANTTVLAERIRAGQVTGGRTTTEATEDPLPLVGEAPRALGRLLDCWSATRGGRASLALVRGDPGTGKTRLLSDLAARARLDGAVVTVARALPDEPPEALWRAWLLGGIEVNELGGAAPTALAGLILLDPDLATRFPAARGSTALPPGDAMTIALLAVADQKPVLVVLDDAHVAPPRVVAALVALVERAKRTPIMVALAAPGDPPNERLDAMAERIGRDIAGVGVETGLLDDASVRELVHVTFPAYESGAADRLSRRVVADSAGNPFLAVELVSAVRAGLVLDDGAPAAWPAEHRTLDQTLPADLPASVSAALRTRYRALSPAAQSALAAVAVLGGTLPRAVLARGAQMEERALDAALDELEWKRWLISDASGYHFLTRLAREVILTDMVTGGQRHRMRERAGIA